MFYGFSKIFWLFFQPLTILFLLVLIGIIAVWRNFRRLGVTVLSLASVLLFVSAFTTTGALLLSPLENRFPRPESLPDRVDGIILLGGYVNGEVVAGRQGVELNSAADRLVETMRLARLYPNAKVVVSGGEGTFFEKSASEADITRTLLADLGFFGKRYVFENKSRNTVENALFSKALIQPKSGETWILVTSAYHMPRAVGCFRKAGFEVTAWPVDYKARRHETFGLYLEAPNEALSRFSVALREWIGLAAYWLTGRTNMLLPHP